MTTIYCTFDDLGAELPSFESIIKRIQYHSAPAHASIGRLGLMILLLVVVF